MTRQEVMAFLVAKAGPNRTVGYMGAGDDEVVVGDVFTIDLTRGDLRQVQTLTVTVAEPDALAFDQEVMLARWR